MAKGFSDTNGEAKKGGNYYKWKDGVQKIRLVGEIVPRYSYWREAINDKGEKFNASIECLSFDRDAEKFTNIEKDWFKHYFPDQNCSWSYVCRAIDPTDSTKTILIPMKKKLYGEIIDVSKELGDPTDPEEGWDCIVERAKTGPLAYNVEYKLKQLQCKTRSLTEEELGAIEIMEPIDDLVPRNTPEEQLEFITKTWLSGGVNETVDENAANEAAEANSTQTDDEYDDIPY